jgi:4-amino-4-deoxy-L-arabinose transferase-like glycosyltransferase
MEIHMTFAEQEKMRRPEKGHGSGAGFVDRYAHVFLLGILLLALAVRICALFDLRETVYFDSLLIDERVYHEWASSIADGTFKSRSVYEFAPLPAYIMAFVYKILSPNFQYVRGMNIILGILLCLLVYLIGRELRDRLAGLLACLVAALYEPFILYSIVPLKTSLVIFLFALAVYLLVTTLGKISFIKVLFLGAVAGLLINSRPNFIVIIPFLPLFVIWDLYKNKTRSSWKAMTITFALYVLGFSLAVSPFVIRNYKAAGQFALTTTQTGRNLYYANNLENRDPYYRPVPFASSVPTEQAVQFTIEASRRVDTRLTPEEASSYWTHEVLKTALEHPAAFMWKLIQKTLVLFNRFEAGDHYHIGFLSRFVTFFKWPFLPFWLILPLGMAGVAVHVFSSRKTKALCLIFVLYSATLVAFYSSTRLRLPLLIILIPFSAIGALHIFSLLLEHAGFKKVGLYAAIVATFLIIAFLPVRGTGDLTAYYNTHAFILDEKGCKDEAIKYWEESSRMDRPYSAYANLFLAGRYYGRGDHDKAERSLKKIPDSSFAASAKYSLIGDLRVHEGKIDDAVAAYEKSLSINSGQRRIRWELIKLYWNRDKERALAEYKTLQYINSFYNKAESRSFE